jgi:hypothetical protein
MGPTRSSLLGGTGPFMKGILHGVALEEKADGYKKGSKSPAC